MSVSSAECPFSSPTLSNQNQRNITASTVVDAYVSTTLHQPTFPKMDGIPLLGEHQKQSKETATMWRDVTRKSLYQSNYDLITFNKAFNNYYTPLVNSASQFDDENKKKADQARKNFVAGLQILIHEIQKNQAACEASLVELQTFQTRLEEDQANLIADDKEGKNEYTSDQGELTKLKKKADADKKAMDQDMEIIAGGGTSNVVGGIMIAVGVLTEIETGGASTALVVGGLAMTGGGSTAVTKAAKDYDKKSKDLAKCTKEIQKINSEIAALHHLTSNLDCLINQASAATAATEAMSKAWQSLGTQFNTVVKDLSQTETATQIPSMFVIASLETGKEDWADVANTAYAIHDSLININVDTSACEQHIPPSATKHKG